nr:hypothetical protein [Tanacetum cinerariifolium]
MSNDRVFCRPCTCERCRRNYTDRFCAICCVESGNAFIDDLITNSFDDLLNSSDHLPQYQTHSFESNGDPPQNSDFRQVIGEMCGIKASAEQKQKLEEMMLEWLELCREKELYRVHDSIEDLIGRAMNTMLLSLNLKSQCLDMEKQEVKSIIKQATKRKTRITESFTIPKTESDEVIKSSVKSLVLIPSESEVTSSNESECVEPVNDESSPIFTTFSNPLFDCNNNFTSSDDKSLSNKDVLMENFKIYSNPIFDDEEIIPTKIDPHYFNAESNLLESFLNRDTLTNSSPKFDYLLEEFSGELVHIDPIPPGIKEANFDLEEEICLDSDSHMEEIDLFLATDDLMPPGIENDDYDSEEDIHFLEELLNNDLLPLPENKSSNFDHHDDLSFPRPPPEPPDVEVFFDFEPDTGVFTAKVVEDIFEHYDCPGFRSLSCSWFCPSSTRASIFNIWESDILDLIDLTFNLLA